jgi:hypothetical protein
MVNGVDVSLEGHEHTKSDITDFNHTHEISDVNGLQGVLDGKSNNNHTHTKSNITDFNHTHEIKDVTGLQGALDGKSNNGHGHNISDVTGLQGALDGKSNNGHGHNISDVDGLQDVLDGKLDEVSDTDSFVIADNVGRIAFEVNNDGVNTGRLMVNGDDVATENYVDGKLTGLFEFKGTIGTTGAKVQALPNSHEVGDAYRVITAGTYTGHKCEAGDMIVCIKEGSTNNTSDWTVLQQNWEAIGGTENLAWNTSTTLATIGGLEIKAKLPEDPKQEIGGYVYIEKYDKTNFENALKTALTEAKAKYDNGTNKNAVILDCTYFTGTHTLSSGFTGFNLETPVKLVFGSIKVVFNNPGDNNLFNIKHNDVSIVGINRNTDSDQIATEDTAANGATLFIMDGDGSNSSDNLNGYHIKSSGFKNILIDSITLRGKRSAMGEYYQSTNYPISGIGGIYIEKGNPSGDATSGLTCNNVRINNVLISETKAHGIYINTPILSSITNTRLSGCGGHGIYILGGTSINMENVYASSGNFAGFCIQNASYVQLANCVAEIFGIGFLIRGSNSVTLHCPGVEETSNFGIYPWRKTTTEKYTEVREKSNDIYGLGLVHTGSNTRINDVASGLDTCFIGYGIYITGGDGINVFSPYIKSIGQSKSKTLGYPKGTETSNKLNFISVVNSANLVNIINPHFKMSVEDSTIISTIKNEIKIGKDAKYVDISYSTDSSPLKDNVSGVLKYTTSSSNKACIYTENGENINTITLKIDNVYESLYAKTMYAENGFYETSDIRKKNILSELPLDKAYDVINNCQSIIYTLKDSTDKHQIGLIAQEVQQYFPEVVYESEDGYLSLDYAKLTSVIFRVLKDVIDRLSKLENK